MEDDMIVLLARRLCMRSLLINRDMVVLYNLMLETEDAISVVDTVAKNLLGVANNRSNFELLPDTYWGYYARGHSSKGKFGVIVVYSENDNDVDELIRIYEQWVSKNKTR